MFLRGRDAGEDGVLFNHLRERGCGQAANFVAEHDALHVQADLFANAVRDLFAVAGQNLQLHAVAPERAHHIRHLFRRRIGKGQKPGQNQIRFVLRAVDRLRYGLFVRDGEDAIAVRAQLLKRRFALCAG